MKGVRVSAPEWVRFFDLPRDRDYGNAIRNMLLRAARGERVIFLDDDNALTEDALRVHLKHRDVEMVVGRIDTSRAFVIPYLPQVEDDRESIRPANVDPLCLCLSRELVVVRCGGWCSERGYEADFVNILRYHRRARSVRFIEDCVGVYDAGQGLDPEGVDILQRLRQARKLDGQGRGG